LRVSVVDKLEIADRRVTTDGYLAVRANIARSGVYQYARSEVGLPGNPNELVGVYRSPDFVFDEKSLATIPHKPITINHPKEGVSAKTWKRDAVGHMGGAAWENEDRKHVTVDMLMMDAAGIEAASTTHQQISLGYSTTVLAQDGVSPEGEPYAAIMTDGYRVDHAALVPLGRAGNTCRVGDSSWPNEITDTTQPKKETPKVAKIVYDGLSVDLSDAEAAQALITKLTDKATRAEAALVDAQDKAKVATKAAETALADATKAHDTAMGQKDAEIADLKGKIVDQSQIDALAQAKADVVDKAKAALGDKAPDFAGKSVPDVRRLSVAVKFGDAAVADKSDDYVEARFDAMVSTADVTDSFRAATAAPITGLTDSDPRKGAFTARQEMIDRMANPVAFDAK